MRVSAVSSLAPTQGTHGRRASVFERLALDAARDACMKWGGDISTLQSVFATHSGDAQAVDRLLRSVTTTPAAPSPLTFLQSVSCTLAGTWATRTHNLAASTTVTAGPHTLGAALLEAAVMVVCEEHPCLLVVADVPPPPPLSMPDHVTASQALAVILSPMSGTGSAIDIGHMDAQAVHRPRVADVDLLRAVLVGKTREVTVASGPSSYVAIHVQRAHPAGSANL
ncbi:beta-ketoacyl synthase chain length factor [Luteibacter sp.]|uniref:beta-ketoacyl synthase chain length factor n=1 Tax=Luteibacter sp. TaxID=1886636 RepID=UPI003F7E8539